MKMTKRTLGLGAMLCASTCLASPAFAAYDLFAPPPSHRTIDQNGIDLSAGTFNLNEPAVAVGPNAADGLFYVRSFIGHGWRHNFVVTIAKNPQNQIVTVSFGGESHQFAKLNGTYLPLDQSPTRLIFNSADSSYTYYSADGTRVVFASTGTPGDDHYQYDSKEGLVQSITYPGGVTVRFTYHPTASCTGCYVAHRLQSVTNNLGYQLKLEYPAVSDQVTTDQQFKDWTNIVKVTAFNMTVEKCDPADISCTLAGTWPSATYATPTGTTSTTQDVLGHTTTYTYSGDQITKTRSPLGVEETIVYDPATKLVTDTTTPSGHWKYTFTVDPANGTMASIKDPANNITKVKSDPDGRITSETDALNNTTSYTYETVAAQQKHLVAIIRPNGKYLGGGVYEDATSFGYDSRGNVNLIQAFPEHGSSLPVMKTSFTFPANNDPKCDPTNPDTPDGLPACNKPVSMIDPRGNDTDPPDTSYQTDFDYTDYGFIKSVKRPAPAAGKPRPEVQYRYEGDSAYYWQKVGGAFQIKQAPDKTVIRPKSIATCMTGSDSSGDGCASGSPSEANGTQTAFTYGPSDASHPSNLLPAQITKGASDDTASDRATTGYAWTPEGDVASIDGPLGSGNDTTAFFYDDARQLKGVISPRADTNVGTNFPAIRYVYNSDGQVTELDRGTTTSRDQAGMDSFTVRQYTANQYTNGQLTRSYLQQTGLRSATEYNYDVAGRLQCVAVRLSNLSVPLSDTCMGGTKDRVTKYEYDERNQVKTLTTAYNRSDSQAVDFTYEVDGQVHTVADGRNNLTTYLYDGLHRLNEIDYPVTTAGSGQSTSSDSERYEYDSNSNVTDIYLRRGDHIQNTMDRLNRVTQRTVLTAPQGAVKSDTVNYEYDNLSRLTQAHTTATDLQFTYDALSRLVAETQPLGVVQSTYNAAGERTKLTWPDGFFVKYDYDWTGKLTAVYEQNTQPGQGPGVLAQIDYDNLGLGRRTSLRRADGDGVKTTYKYDDNNGQTPWLTELDLGFRGAHAVTYTFDNTPAGQINWREIDNDEFAWTDHHDLDLDYTPINGLNQPPKAGSQTLTWNSAGDLASDGSKIYAYDSDNRLYTAGNKSLRYDALGRLYRLVGPPETRFLYDGNDVIAEYDSSNVLQNRYVHGDGPDEPLVWYVGSGTTDRRWLVADNQGSIVGAANATGVLMSQGGTPLINTYDEYGVPGSANFGRFQYTGQAWLPDVGAYYYKARTYSPTLGRFLQPDPIGYAAGMNLYAYVGDDPINFIDSLGLVDTDVDPFDVWAKKLEGPPSFAGGVGSLFVNIYQAGSGGERASDANETEKQAKNEKRAGCPAGTISKSELPSGTGTAIGHAAAQGSMPTVPKPGAIAGGGRSGPWTSQASLGFRSMTGYARFGPLRPMTGTSSVGGSLGRSLPMLGAFLGFFDYVQGMQKLEEDDNPDCIPYA